jgi:hypothetical protein
MLLPTILFAVFALASAGGSYLLFAHQRGRRVGLAAALLVLLFFAALFWAVLHLVASGGLPGANAS